MPFLKLPPAPVASLRQWNERSAPIGGIDFLKIALHPGNGANEVIQPSRCDLDSIFKTTTPADALPLYALLYAPALETVAADSAIAFER